MTTKQTVTATIEFEFTDEDIDLHIFGSGFGQWDWWHAFGGDTSPTGVWISADDPNGEESDAWGVPNPTIQKFVSFDHIRTVVGEILSGRHNVPLARQQLANGNVDEMDLDADGADQIMQIAMYGEVVYG